MTAILAARLPEGLILAADSRWERKNGEGEYTGGEASRKVVYGHPPWALAVSGDYSLPVLALFERLSGDPRYGSSPEDVAAGWATAVRTRKYPAIGRANRTAAQEDLQADLPVFALAAYAPSPGIWGITPFGDLLDGQEEADMPFPLLVLGAQGGAAKKEVQRLLGSHFNPAALTVGEVSGMFYQAIRAVSPEQPGPIPELVILTPAGVQDYGGRFRAALGEREAEIYQEMTDGGHSFRLVGDARAPRPLRPGGWNRERAHPVGPELPFPAER